MTNDICLNKQMNKWTSAWNNRTSDKCTLHRPYPAICGTDMNYTWVRQPFLETHRSTFFFFLSFNLSLSLSLVFMKFRIVSWEYSNPYCVNKYYPKGKKSCRTAGKHTMQCINSTWDIISKWHLIARHQRSRG